MNKSLEVSRKEAKIETLILKASNDSNAMNLLAASAHLNEAAEIMEKSGLIDKFGTELYMLYIESLISIYDYSGAEIQIKKALELDKSKSNHQLYYLLSLANFENYKERSLTKAEEYIKIALSEQDIDPRYWLLKYRIIARLENEGYKQHSKGELLLTIKRYFDLAADAGYYEILNLINNPVESLFENEVKYNEYLIENDIYSRDQLDREFGYTSEKSYEHDAEDAIDELFDRRGWNKTSQENK